MSAILSGLLAGCLGLLAMVAVAAPDVRVVGLFSDRQVFINPRGMYTTVGAINGLPVPFLVDTGASSVAMNSDQARRPGIDFRVDGERVSVVTASGNMPAWRVMPDSVKLGDIEVKNVLGVVIDGAEPGTTLLGMSFLNRLDISNDGQLMTLQLKY